MPTTTLIQAYTYCEQLAKSHYENFPVASILLPKHLRLPVSVIYAFARSADDFADEGDLTPTERYELLANYHQELDNIQHAKSSNHPIFIALADVIQQFNLPLELFHDLLNAFEQDIETKSYQNFEQILDYCRQSANPVGRLLLYLNNQASAENLSYSDHICTGLQLINFLQDIQQDYLENQRFYIAQDDMQSFQLNDQKLGAFIQSNTQLTGQVKQLYDSQLKKTRDIFMAGKPLIKNLNGRFGFEIRAIFYGGLCILNKLDEIQYLSKRPRLNPGDKITLFFKSFF